MEPHDQGLLDVGDGQVVYWETRGNPHGLPAVAVHGGPGSGSSEWWATLFDPDAYHVVLFDQRGCGRSTPHASEPEIDLSANTTWHLVADMERLREHLGFERWLVLGGSWGSVLSLAYAVTHPERVSALVVFGVATGRWSEVDWLFRGGIAVFFPEEWDRLCAAVPADAGDGDIVEVYSRLLHDPDPEIRTRAARAWCLWESATPVWPPKPGLQPRFEDTAYALAFARLVTHYIRHNAWVDDDELLRRANVLADTPGAIVNGRFDFQSPLANAWELKRAWPGAELVLVDDAGHAPDDAVTQELIRVTRRLAALRHSWALRP